MMVIKKIYIHVHVLLFTTCLNLKMEVAHVQIIKFHTLHIISESNKIDTAL